MCVLSCSVVSNSATPWTVARKVPLSVRLSLARILEWVAISFSKGSSGFNPWSGNENPTSQEARPKYFFLLKMMFCLPPYHRRQHVSLIKKSCPSVGGWILCAPEAMECYSGPKSNELPTHEKTWRSLKYLSLTEKVNLKRPPAVVAFSLVLRELQIKTMRNHLFSLIIIAKLQKVNNTHSVTEATGEQELSFARGNVPWKNH